MEQAAQEKKPGFFRRIGNFFTEVRGEMRKVTWPPKPELTGATVVLLVVAIVLSVVLSGIDVVFGTFSSFIFGL